jgi:hypothetical protein
MESINSLYEEYVRIKCVEEFTSKTIVDLIEQDELFVMTGVLPK